MNLSLIDWLIIISYLIISLLIGLRYKKRAGKSLSDYFLSGRKLPWHIAGISMVATTFAADTPLAVTELVAKNGISGNWLWWNMLIGGMLTTFFFARLWRRANILTEVEFVELRYSGKPAAFLRGFKSIYMGIFMNAIIIGWVNIAMMSILKIFFDLPDEQLIWYIAIAMTITVIYSTISGLWGVVITDTIQFFIAMTGCIVLAVIVISSPKIGGITGLKSQLPAWSLNFFPDIGKSQSVSDIAHTLSISIGAFFAYTTVQWWASWYPGAEPGGGGYIAQRMMSCKNEKHSVFATLFFQITHYSLRPWPWILVGLASIVLYPELGIDEKRVGYVLAMRDFLPVGLKGLLLVAFLAAYMSTISTQLNWGASYLVNDFYKRFIKPENKFKNKKSIQKNYVFMGKVFTLLIMLIALFVTTQIKTIKGAWEFIIECGAGLGMVLILRWYWWRINAWSEIIASILPFIAYGFAKFYLEKYMPESFIINKGSFFFTVGITTISWLLITFLTKPTNKNKLISFYKLVRPDGIWNPVIKSAGINKHHSQICNLIICWISSIIMTYSILFFTGKAIFLEWSKALMWFVIAAISFIILRIFISKTKILDN
jgi:Na+/proline symporter